MNAKKSVFDIYGQIQNAYSNRSLFLAPFFKLYSDPDGNAKDLNTCFSMNDFKKMPPSELENKVFVKASSPDNIKLDDNLILNTVFFQIKL